MSSELEVFLGDRSPEYAQYITSYPFDSETAIHEFLGSSLPEDLQREVRFKAVADREMAKANYAWIRIGDKATSDLLA
jgi:hypothetical protein